MLPPTSSALIYVCTPTLELNPSSLAEYQHDAVHQRLATALIEDQDQGTKGSRSVSAPSTVLVEDFRSLKRQFSVTTITSMY
ncbi:Regulator of cytoskeleton and endocytosis [Venturia inaequalis]|nr:Regulator of cytoskeleton and endocytosis [Venturia inaequalis]